MAYTRTIRTDEAPGVPTADHRHMLDSSHRFTRHLSTACLISGPLLFASSTFFWHEGRYGATGGALIALSMPVWTYGIIALLNGMRAKLPRYAAAVLLLALLGALGGSAFGFQGFFETAYGIDHDSSLTALAEYPVAAGILLWWIGPLFPATLFALGAGLIRTRALPIPVALLMCLAAILFPISRIPRIDWIAHLVDALLAIPFLTAALTRPPQPPPTNHP